MSRKFTLAFDVGETEIYERVGKDDAFIVRLTESEAELLINEIRRQIDNE